MDKRKKDKIIITIFVLIISIPFIINIFNEKVGDFLFGLFGIASLIIAIFIKLIIFIKELIYKKLINEEDKLFIKDYQTKKYYQLIQEAIKNEVDNIDYLYISETLEQIEEICNNVLKGTNNIYITQEELNEDIKKIEELILIYNIENLIPAPNDIKKLFEIVYKYYNRDGKIIKGA